MNFKIVAIIISIISMGMSSVTIAKQNHEKPLPPGLQKKVERGGELPPGWQKKLQVGETLDQDVYDHGHVVETGDGLVTINVEGKLIRVIENTHEIIEILQGM